MKLKLELTPQERDLLIDAAVFHRDAIEKEARFLKILKPLADQTIDALNNLIADLRTL